MLLANLDYLINNPWFALWEILGILASLVIGITIHEFSHAILAYKFGDDTAKLEGRLTINPMKHLDPMGSIMLLVAGFGWGTPVPVNPFKVGKKRSRNLAIISLAGPISNLILGAILGTIFRMGLFSTDYSINSFPIVVILDLMITLIYVNVILAIFNLIPISPLDGSKILAAILPSKYTPYLIQLDRWGPPILLSVIVVDIFLNIGILSTIISPIVLAIVKLFIGT